MPFEADDVNRMNSPHQPVILSNEKILLPLIPLIVKVEIGWGKKFVEIIYLEMSHIIVDVVSLRIISVFYASLKLNCFSGCSFVSVSTAESRKEREEDATCQPINTHSKSQLFSVDILIHCSFYLDW